MPIGDPLVDIFVSRDLDSPIIDREREAVKIWEKSDKILHYMRDHPYHRYPILGGMWGAKVKKLDPNDTRQIQIDIIEVILLVIFQLFPILYIKL